MPLLHQFQESNKKMRNAKCPDFCILKRNANCLALCEVCGFLYIKNSRNAKCHAFVYKRQIQNFHEKLRNVKCLAFCILKRNGN